MGFCLIFVVKVIVKEVEERESEGCGVSTSKKMVYNSYYGRWGRNLFEK